MKERPEDQVIDAARALLGPVKWLAVFVAFLAGFLAGYTFVELWAATKSPDNKLQALANIFGAVLSGLFAMAAAILTVQYDREAAKKDRQKEERANAEKQIALLQQAFTPHMNASLWMPDDVVMQADWIVETEYPGVVDGSYNNLLSRFKLAPEIRGVLAPIAILELAAIDKYNESQDRFASHWQEFITAPPQEERAYEGIQNSLLQDVTICWLNFADLCMLLQSSAKMDFRYTAATIDDVRKKIYARMIVRRLDAGTD